MAGQIAKIETGGAIAALVPTNFDEVWRVAQAVHTAGMAPYGLNTPEKITIAIMTGLELGMPPMRAVQSIAIINNRPCIWGDALPAVCYASGAVRYIKEWVEGEGAEMVAYCETLRVGQQEPVRRSFSVKDAIQAGLWQTTAKVRKKNRQTNEWYETDNDSPWWRYPKRMLGMRARGFTLRDSYPDKLAGMQMAEEVQDYVAERDQPVADLAPVNPLIDPPIPANDAIEAKAGGSLVIDEQAFLKDEQDDQPGQAEASAPEQSDDRRLQDSQSGAMPTEFTLAGITVQAPGEDFSTVDFGKYLSEMIAAMTMEGVLGVDGKVKEAVSAMPSDHKTLYQLASGYKRSIIKGTSADPEGNGLKQLLGWVVSGFGRDE